MRRTSLVALLWLSLGTLRVLAQAPPDPHPPVAHPSTPPPARPTVASIQAQLASTDPATIRAGIAAAAALPGPGTVAALGARIRDGLAPELLDDSIAALTRMRRPEAGGVLARLVTHRRAAVRQQAIAAIVALHATGTEAALVAALDDGDPGVRGAAALALSQVGARGSLPALYRALSRGLPEAATAIGRLAPPAQSERLFALVPTLDFTLLARAFDELLHRADVPAATKLAIVTRLGERNTAEVRQFLQHLAGSLPVTDPLRQAATRATEAAEESAPAAATPGATP